MLQERMNCRWYPNRFHSIALGLSFLATFSVFFSFWLRCILILQVPHFDLGWFVQYCHEVQIPMYFLWSIRDYLKYSYSSSVSLPSLLLVHHQHFSSNYLLILYFLLTQVTANLVRLVDFSLIFSSKQNLLAILLRVQYHYYDFSWFYS